MDKRNLVISFVAVLILAGGAGYYFWSKRVLNIPSTSSGEVVIPQESSSFLDTFFEKIKLSDKPKQPSSKEYKDPAGVFSINYPPSWVTRSEQGKLLKGASLTPPELIDKYSAEEQPFVKGLVVAATESEESPEGYFRKSVAGFETGQTEAKNLTINGYPAHFVRGNTKGGISYTIYIVSHNNRIVYFNYRTMETEEAHQNDIKKAIDFGPYVADFEAAIASIKFLK